jgi:hypothetical protein
MLDRQQAIFLKGKAIIKSCVTPEHCVVAHNWLKLAERELERRDIKILQVTGVIE